jgi:hypothetical protein
VTVSSNAKNEPSVRLSLGGTFRPMIEVEPLSIRLTSAKGSDTGEIITMKTEKPDLKITEVFFTVTGGGKEMDWKSNIPLQFTMLGVETPKEKPEPPKVKSERGKAKQEPVVAKEKEPLKYRMRISYTPFDKEDKYGEVTLKTNMTEKPELKISGVLEAKKQ